MEQTIQLLIIRLRCFYATAFPQRCPLVIESQTHVVTLPYPCSTCRPGQKYGFLSCLLSSSSLGTCPVKNWVRSL